jgi:hypothetical protein
MFFVSAIRTYSRGWPRSSSTHEPSDPPLRMESRRFSIYLSHRPVVIYICIYFNFSFKFYRAVTRVRICPHSELESTGIFPTSTIPLAARVLGAKIYYTQTEPVTLWTCPFRSSNYRLFQVESDLRIVYLLAVTRRYWDLRELTYLTARRIAVLLVSIGTRLRIKLDSMPFQT